MLPALLGANDAAKKALEALAAGERRVGIVGAEGTGKSAVLDEVAKGLRAKGQVVHRLAFVRGDDAAFAAMVALAGQLDPTDSNVLPAIRDDRRPFGDKLKVLANELESRKGTLLVDDLPLRRRDLTSTVFDERVTELAERLLQLRDLNVVVSSWQRLLSPSLVVQARFDAAHVFSEIKDEVLRVAASKLQQGGKLIGYSPVEMRLVVAAVTRNQPIARLRERRWDPSELLAVVLEGESKLRHLVGSLALTRVPFDDDLLAMLGTDALSVYQRPLLDEVLLMHTSEGHILHGLIGRRARSDGWLSAPDEVRAHTVISAWHRRRFDACKSRGDVVGSVENEIEIVHHLTQAGDVDAVLSMPVYFSEQYDALGKALSLGGRYSDAVRAYERAVTFDDAPDRVDAYGHHYLAYNLDVLGLEQERVRSDYEIARKELPTHPWYWGRLICFLVTTGYLDDAMNVWSEAATTFQMDNGEEWIATELHRNVAHLLTHRGQIASARRVLRDVPSAARTFEWYVALDGWLAELEAAERDELVFPPTIEPSARWERPHLLRNPPDRDRVLEWRPGAITSSDAEGIRIRVARREPDGRVTYAYVDYSNDELERLTTYPKYGLHLPAGTFVEILTMKGSANELQEQLLSWPRQARRLPGLPPIFPAPDRYIRREFARG